jgi:hypothetical protein
VVEPGELQEPRPHGRGRRQDQFHCNLPPAVLWMICLCSAAPDWQGLQSGHVMTNFGPTHGENPAVVPMWKSFHAGCACCDLTGRDDDCEIAAPALSQRKVQYNNSFLRTRSVIIQPIRAKVTRCNCGQVGGHIRMSRNPQLLLHHHHLDSTYIKIGTGRVPWIRI